MGETPSMGDQPEALHGTPPWGFETKDTRIGTDQPVERGPANERHRLARDIPIPSDHLFYTTTYTRPARHRSGNEPSTRALDRRLYTYPYSCMLSSVNYAKPK